MAKLGRALTFYFVVSEIERRTDEWTTSSKKEKEEEEEGMFGMRRCYDHNWRGVVRCRDFCDLPATMMVVAVNIDALLLLLMIDLMIVLFMIND